MSDKYTFTIDSVCGGGEHLTISMYRNNEKYKTFNVSREDIVTGAYKTWPEVSPLLLAKALKSAGSKTDAEHKTVIESLVISL